MSHTPDGSPQQRIVITEQDLGAQPDRLVVTAADVAAPQNPETGGALPGDIAENGKFIIGTNSSDVAVGLSRNEIVPEVVIHSKPLDGLQATQAGGRIVIKHLNQ